MGHSSLLEIACHTYKAKILLQWDNRLQPLEGSLPCSRTQLVFCLHGDNKYFHRFCKKAKTEQTTEKIAMDVVCVTTHGAKRSFSISKVDDKKQSFFCRIYFGWRLIQFAKPYFLTASCQYILWTEYKNPLVQRWEGTVENTVTLKWYFWKMKILC